MGPVTEEERLARAVARWQRMGRRPPEIEVPGPGQESVWDFPRPPRVEPVASPVRVELARVVVAETSAALRVLETAGAPVYCIPPGDVRLDLLAPSSRRSTCEWKGEAVYWHVTVGDDRREDAAWSYPHPFPKYGTLRDYVAFYADRMDACYVGAERVRAQPGGFYGGWVPANLTGPFKGEAGSEWW